MPSLKVKYVSKVDIEGGIDKQREKKTGGKEGQRVMEKRRVNGIQTDRENETDRFMTDEPKVHI